MVTDPGIGSRTSAYFWNTKGLNQLADKNTEAFYRLITKRINGGYNGWEDRLFLWKRTKEILAIS
jgi:predicted chitinase